MKPPIKETYNYPVRPECFCAAKMYRRVSQILLPLFIFTASTLATPTPYTRALKQVPGSHEKLEDFSDLGVSNPAFTPSSALALTANLDASTADTVTLIRGDVSYGSQTPITISRAGTYSLTGPLSATGSNTALTISASNVSLDLSGNTISGGATGINITGNAVAIQNGVVQNASGTGIRISGTKCQLENLDVISSQTGFLLQSTAANQLTNCRALNSTSAGFSLVSSSTNNFMACQALNTNGGTSSAYGFISQAGYGNNFEQCITQNTRTSSVRNSDMAAGYLLSAENSSAISDSQALGTLSLVSTTTAYGIYFRNTQKCVSTHNTASNNTTVNTLGVGIRADSSINYVAENLSYNNNTNFQSVSTSYLASQANARGADNIDTSLTDPDMIETINTNAATLVQENWSIESKCENISSKITALFPCAATPITSSGTKTSNKANITSAATISQSGSYCLSANITTGGITISGNNITLDMNNYAIIGTAGLTVSGNVVTVRNGTIRTATTNGITLSGSRCTLENLDVIGSPTGFYFSGATANEISNCRALNCTQNGFYLNGSTKNRLSTCAVNNLGGSSSSVTGFLTSGGQANTFDSCTVNNAFTTANSVAAQAHGFRIVGENYSTISNCTVNGVSTTAALPNLYGIRAPLTQSQDILFTPTSVKYGDSVAWLQRENNRYLAVGMLATPAAGYEVDILKYTGATLTPVATQNWPYGIKGIDWVVSGATNYLALGLGSGSGGTPGLVEVLQFIEPDTLITITGFNNSSNVNNVSWLSTCTSGATNLYLAMVGSRAVSNGIIRVLKFNGSTLQEACNVVTGPSSNSCSWLTIEEKTYLAVGTNLSGGQELFVYEFVGNALTPLISQEMNQAIYSTKWLTTNTGKYYLAATGARGVYLFQFDPTTSTITLKSQYSNVSTTFNSSWLAGIDDLNYLAVAGISNNNKNVSVLRFDGSCLSSIYDFSSSFSALDVDWLTTGSTLLAIAQYSPTGPVHSIGFSPTCNLIQNNTVNNVRGGTSATAFAVEANNLPIGNVAYNNGTNYYYTPESGDSNQGIAGS